MWRKNLFRAWDIPSVLILTVILSSCGSSGGGGDGDGDGDDAGGDNNSDNALYTIGGTVSGLAEGNFELYFTYRDAEYEYTNVYESAGNENFTLDLRLPDHTPYRAWISQMPDNPAQHCMLENNYGSISGSNVTDFNITCHKYKNITVTASGLRLYDLAVSINIDGIINPRDLNTIVPVDEIQEIDYSPIEDVQLYSARIIENSSFNISVVSPPYPQDQQVCHTSQSSGVAAETDINIQISCMKAGSVGGSVVGLNGGDLVIQNNGGSSLTISQDGQFTFSDLIPVNSNYEVSIASNPNSPNQLCKIDNGTGTLPDVVNSTVVPRVADVLINCYEKPVLNATSMSGEVILDWPDITANQYNIYYSSDKNFNPDDYAAYADGASLQDVTSPITVSGLENKKGYYFVLEAVHGINLPYSEKAGARPDNLIVDDTVNSIATSDAGDVYIGGVFTKVRATSGQGIPFNTHNRSLSIANYPLVNGKVTASVSDGLGGWYIGGDFTNVGGYAREKLAHILSDGSLDPFWHPDVSDGSIQTIYFFNDVIYVGGTFSTVDGYSHQNFVAIGSDGLIKPWNLDTDGTVKAFASSGSVIYMGGLFSTVGGVSRSNIAEIDSSGVLTNFEVDISGIVNCMQVYNETLYIAGQLRTVAGVTARNGVIALDLNGIPTGWTSGNKGGQIKDLLVHDDIVFFSGVLFSSEIAAVHVDGRPVSWDPGISYGYANHLELVGDKLVAGGDFQIVGTYPDEIPDVNKRFNIAAYNLNTSSLTLSPYGPYYEMSLPMHRWNPAIDDDVTTMAVSGDSIYLGGQFNGIGGVQRTNVLSINANGTLSDWDPQPNGTVNSVLVNGDTIYLAGGFTQVGESDRVGVAAIDLTGTPTTWNPIIDGNVNALLIDVDTLYIGGSFTSVNGQSRASLASIQTDGTLLNWAPNLNGQVKTIAKNNGNLYIGGTFGTVNDLDRSYIASFDDLGDLTDWSPGISNVFNGWLYPSVNTILPIGNTIYFGGHFTSVDGNERHHAASVDEDGVLTSWDPDISHNDQLLLVNQLAHYQNQVVIGGKFSSVGVSTRNSLALVGEDGVLNAWDPDVNGFVKALHVSAGALIVGGNFSGLGLGSQSNVARFDASGVLQ